MNEWTKPLSVPPLVGPRRMWKCDLIRRAPTVFVLPQPSDSFPSDGTDGHAAARERGSRTLPAVRAMQRIAARSRMAWSHRYLERERQTDLFRISYREKKSTQGAFGQGCPTGFIYISTKKRGKINSLILQRIWQNHYIWSYRVSMQLVNRLHSTSNNNNLLRSLINQSFFSDQNNKNNKSIIW